MSIKNKKQKNKRGDVPVTILVIGIVAICIFAILSFESSLKRSQESFVGIGLIETIISIEEEIRFDKVEQLGKFSGQGVIFELGKPLQKYVKIVANENQIKGNYTTTEGWIWNKKEKTWISVEYKLND